MDASVANVHGWIVEHTSGSARARHERLIPDSGDPTVSINMVSINTVSQPAIVLGSTQDASIVDEAAAAHLGVEVCRRRSGGGLVALSEGNDLWIDVLLPRSSHLWDDDVGAAFSWLGETWAAALRSTAAPSAGPVEVHNGRLLRPEAGRVLCFAGLGPGEVTIDGRKAVGMSQRRTRHAATFHTVATWRWPPPWLRQLVDHTLLDAVGVSDLEGLPIGLDSDDDRPSPTVKELLDAFLAVLPAL